MFCTKRRKITCYLYLILCVGWGQWMSSGILPPLSLLKISLILIMVFLFEVKWTTVESCARWEPNNVHGGGFISDTDRKVKIIHLLFLYLKLFLFFSDDTMLSTFCEWPSLPLFFSVLTWYCHILCEGLNMCVHSEIICNLVMAAQNAKIRFVNIWQVSSLTMGLKGFRYTCFCSHIKTFPGQLSWVLPSWWLGLLHIWETVGLVPWINLWVLT